tara:strand:- start:1475 stop:1633 length:159 start_codon:yes stop_codon:yes gene_type:complete
MKELTYEKILAEYKKRKIKDPEKAARAYMKGLTSTEKGRSKLTLKSKKKIYN